ncbi:hypothetical protein PSHT_13678 [Puccinia striiformis]|uniref:DyP dimeric alpha+beta barrel domain-containing protein n=1 Tax=Puccinia striiformis TaxID=27350 RepID=A0A2S4UP48_9BASI|nr:hypothetical protein PSHT_13678 [Puccinia striiformis]
MSSTNVDLKNVQGDIIIGLQKRVEAFWFGSLKTDGKSIEGFRKNLKSSILPLITSTQEVIDTQKKIDDHKRLNQKSDGSTKELLPITQLNLGFSFTGLKKLGLKVEEIPSGANGIFSKGQKVDAVDNLGDPVDQTTKKLKTWSQDFRSEASSIDFVILVTAPDHTLLGQRLDQIRKNLDGFLSTSFVRQGAVRPGNQSGHEHFGFLDGISAPAIEGINSQPGDKKSGIVKPDVIYSVNLLPVRLIQTKLGLKMARFWRAPLTLTPVQDKPELNRAQDFDYSDELNQERCPYAAHIRKTNPRPELTDEEKKSKKTKENRGLLFVSYQSKIESGFQFVQKFWCNNTDFPSKTPAKVTPGFDLLIGQTSDEKPRVAQNINPLGIAGTTDPNNVLTAPEHFIIPLGGEYFLMPSIKAIKEKLSL